MDELDPESKTGELSTPGLADPVMLASGVAAGALVARAASAGLASRGSQALSRQLIGESAQPSAGMLRQFQGQLTQHGRRSVERSLRRLEGRLVEHLEKVDDIVARGGDPGSVVREIRNFRRQIEAARQILD